MKPYREELAAIDFTAMETYLKEIASLDKLSGSEEASKGAAYILEELKKAGVPCHMETYEGYMSNPLNGSLKVDGEMNVLCRPRAFSGRCPEGILGELIFDAASKNRKRADLTSKDFLSTVRGKIVLAYGFDERYALLLEKYGAAGWIQIWTSSDPLIHEDTAGCIWGTPTVDGSLLLLNMPVVGVTKADGELLIRRMQEAELAKKTVTAELAADVDNKISLIQMPVAEIKGESEDFVLVSCHYDTWFLGAIDNGTANAAAMEIAKVCSKFRHRMKRSVRIVWWAGHSNGRYAGSTWYCDHHYMEIKEHCIAHINADLIGAKGGQVIGFHTTGAEGKAYLRESADFVAPEDSVLYFSIGRGADQSFFGPEVPYHIYSRYEAEPAKKPFDTPATGGYQWHTADDTLDVVDWQIYRKDAAVFFLNTWRFLAEESLPFASEEFFENYREALRIIDNSSEEAFSTEEIRQAVDEIEGMYRKIAETGGEMADACIRLICGRLNRLRFSYGSQYDHDLAITATASFPRLSMVQGIKRGETESDRYLFIQTDFVRQKNRMLLELKTLKKEISYLKN